AALVVSKEVTDALLSPADRYRDRTVVPYLSLELSRFEVKHPGGGFAIERIDERSFKIAGLDVLAGRSELDKVWSALAETRAESFPKEADIDRLTKVPRLTITMTPKDASKGGAELVFGEACPGHPNDVAVVRTKPTPGVACGPKGALETLLGVSPASLVD